MATAVTAKLYRDRLNIIFYQADDPANGLNASVCLTREEVCELLRKIDEAIPEDADTSSDCEVLP